MQDSIGMQILDAQAHLNEEFPDLAFPQVFAHLSLQVLSQVFILTELHDDIELRATLERVIKAHDVGIFELVHEEGLTEGFFLLEGAHATEIDLLEHVDFPVGLLYDAVHHSEGPLPKLLFELEFVCAIVYHFWVLRGFDFDLM